MLTHTRRSRKVYSHAHLVSDVIHQLAPRFTPKIHMIKMQIESLIEREYIKRTEDSVPAAYAYMA